MNKKSFYFIAGVLLIIGALMVIKRSGQQHVPISLPAIVLKDSTGNIVDLNSDAFKGKPLVINFWGSWCGPCRQELPVFENARIKYNGRVNFIMVSDESTEKILKFKSENSYGFLYLQSAKRFQDMKISAVPVTCFYDKWGKLITQKNDPPDEATLNGCVDELL